MKIIIRSSMYTPSLLSPIDHPLGRSFFLSPTFLCFKNPIWWPHISRRITERSLAKNTPALQANVKCVSSTVVLHNRITKNILVRLSGCSTKNHKMTQSFCDHYIKDGFIFLGHPRVQHTSGDSTGGGLGRTLPSLR